VTAAASVAGFMKRHVLGPSLIRRNPFFYESSREVLEDCSKMDLAERRAWSESQIQKTLELASRTRYGRAFGGGRDLSRWPLLEKEKLRGNQSDFTYGNTWLSAPASTGGTTGIPLRLARSLRGVVFEQACQDMLIEQLGSDPHGRVAILRGDNIKDPSDLKPPYWEIANGGRSMIFSSNVLMKETVGDYVQALRDFKPTLLCAYPTSLESLCRLMQQQELSVNVPYVLTSSEVLKREAWTLAHDTLGCELVDYYG
jgi:phenylacetate-coenzyme A ligase PaaK-like adenylate-forming protein